MASWSDLHTLLWDDSEDIDRDTIESEKDDCVAELQRLEDKLERFEASAQESIEKARSADNPNQHYEDAAKQIREFREKKSGYEGVAKQYVILMILTVLADQDAELETTTLDSSDSLSDLQKGIVHVVRGEQMIDRIPSTLNRRIDDSEVPSGPRGYFLGQEFDRPTIDTADHPDHEQTITWLEQIADAVLDDELVGIPNSWLLTGDDTGAADVSVPDDDRPKNPENQSLSSLFYR
jgi:hypothetical protein